MTRDEPRDAALEREILEALDRDRGHVQTASTLDGLGSVSGLDHQRDPRMPADERYAAVWE